jgi:hypothetical protein
VRLDPSGIVANVYLTSLNGDNSNANVDMRLDLQFGDGSVSLPFNLIFQQTNFLLNWQFNDSNGSLSTTGDFGSVTDAEFDALQLQVNPFAGFVNNAVEKIKDFAKPFQPIASILSTEIPGLSSIGIDITFADVIDKLSGNHDMSNIVNFINDASNLNSQVPTGTGGTISYSNLVLEPNGSSLLAALQVGNPLFQPGGGAAQVPQPIQGVLDVIHQLNSIDSTGSLSVSPSWKTRRRLATCSLDTTHPCSLSKLILA